MNLRSTAADILNFLFRPKRFAASAPVDVRNFYHRLFRLLHWREVRRRQQLYASIREPAAFAIPEDKGFLKVELDPAIIAAAVGEAKKILASKLTPEFKTENQHRHLINFDVREGMPLDPFLEIAVSKPLVKALADYMGMIPVIENIYVGYSPNRQNISASSQEHHLDGQDVRTLQLYVFIEDIDSSRGPLVVVDAKQSMELAKDIGYRKTKQRKRVDDDLITSKVDPSNISELTGKAGDCFMIDTDRCFHYGSRKGTRERFVLVFQYYTPIAFVLPYRWWKKLPFAAIRSIERFDAVERAVLGAKS